VTSALYMDLLAFTLITCSYLYYDLFHIQYCNGSCGRLNKVSSNVSGATVALRQNSVHPPLLLLLIAGNYKIRRLRNIQWHNVRAKFRGKRLILPEV
jgi:hypothetical protein